jgi:hypothetical protein
MANLARNTRRDRGIVSVGYALLEIRIRKLGQLNRPRHSGARVSASPESILPIVVIDSGLSPAGCPGMTSGEILAHQFNTRLWSGLSSEKVGTSISNRSPLSLTIW